MRNIEIVTSIQFMADPQSKFYANQAGQTEQV